MGDSDYSDWGREIGEKINKFVNSKEIKDLQDNIKVTVEKTMNDVGHSVKHAADYMNKNVEIRWSSSGHDKGVTFHTEKNDQTENGFQTGADPGSGEQRNRTYNRTAYHSEQRNRYQPVQKTTGRQLPVKKKPEGTVSGILLIVFGLAGGVISFFAGVFHYFWTVLISGIPGVSTLSIGFTAGVFCLCLIAVFTGGFLRNRVGIFRRYIKMMDSRDFYPVEELSQGSRRKKKAVIRDLKKMIKRHWFMEGHLDEQETCFILTDEAWKMYLDAQKELEKQKEEAQKLADEQERMEQDPVLKQLKVTVEEGREYIRRIREVNDDIPGEEISQKLYRLEKVTTRIFDHVKDNPDKLSDIRRFMNYYLPTTLKLVESYHEFCVQPVQGENITAAEKEIEDMLDEINGAFEKLFDKLFADDAMDISTDISAMSAMLAQEGLLENEFGKKES